MSEADDDTQPFGRWTNWDTWDANLWLTNDQNSYNAAMARQTAAGLREVFEKTFRDIAMSTGFTDGIDPAKVNWQEIYNSLHEGE